MKHSLLWVGLGVVLVNVGCSSPMESDDTSSSTGSVPDTFAAEVAEQPGLDAKAVAKIGADAPLATDSQPHQYTDPETGETYWADYNRRIIATVETSIGDPQVEGTLGEQFDQVGAALTALDASGKVELQYTSCETPVANVKKQNCACGVSASYVLVGGGALVDWQDPGAMLYESRPLDSDNNGAGTTWIASSKAHMADASHLLTCYAVGMRVKQTNGNWLPRATLKQNVDYRKVTAAASDAPTASCSVPVGKVAVGGGARSNWTGAGQLLTQSYPSSTTSWRGASKAHMLSDPSTLDVYCIGVSSTIANFGTFNWTRPFAGHFTQTGADAAYAAPVANPKSLPTCAAGVASFEGAGRLLYGLFVSPDFSIAFSKDHVAADAGITTAYAPSLRRQ